MAAQAELVWPTKDIVYVSVVGVVMLAALLEWFLWLSAFIYCLIKVYQKAENTSTRILAVVMMILFSFLRFVLLGLMTAERKREDLVSMFHVSLTFVQLTRAIFLPIMLVTLPLPPQITNHFPHDFVALLQWVAFWAFSSLLTIPWLLCIYQLVTNSLGRTKKIKEILDEIAAPKVVIVMPCYKELPEILLRTVDSLVTCEYPGACLHIFLSFDGDQEDELYLNTIEKLGVPLVRQSGYPTSIDVTYRNTRVTISRFPHGGKRHCQKRTFKLIDKIYTEYLKVNDNLFVLFIDSDCILDKVCIQNFMYEMELKPGTNQNMLAMTGVITATTEKNSLITLLQDIEYIHGQLFERSVESGCGAVTCLPGALTILRFSAFRKLAKHYFADKAEQCDDLFDYGKCHLGEDRWLTHLLMIAAEKPYQIGMSTGAFCKTEAVQDFKSLLKQRRRWFLGFITNEVCMLTDIRLWLRYPFLCLIRLGQNTIRTTALLFFIMVISLLTTSQRIDELPVGFIAVSLGLNWVLMCCFAAMLGRYKTMLYPLLFVLGPFLNWIFMVYGIFTAGQRTWGGPRADAGQADLSTSPQAAIEHALATGDDLNVIPETFRPAMEAQRLGHGNKTRHVPLQPSARFEGRFRPTSTDFDMMSTESSSTLILGPSSTVPRHVPLHPRASWDSSITTSSAGHPVHLPRRVESFIDLEGRLPARGFRAHPPSAQSAYFESRRAQARLSGQSLSSTRPGSGRYTSGGGSEDSVDMGLTGRMSVFREDLDHGVGIPLMDLGLGASRTGEGVVGSGRGSRASSAWHERSPLRLSHVNLADEALGDGMVLAGEGVRGFAADKVLLEGQGVDVASEADEEPELEAEKSRKKKRLSIAGTIASFAGGVGRGRSLRGAEEEG